MKFNKQKKVNLMLISVVVMLFFFFAMLREFTPEQIGGNCNSKYKITNDATIELIGWDCYVSGIGKEKPFLEDFWLLVFKSNQSCVEGFE